MNALISLCTVLVLLTLPVHAQNSISCSPGDLNSLRTFVEHLESGVDGWDFVSSSGNCCNWTGITCDFSRNGSSIGRVVGLDLGSRRLRGVLSDSLGDLDQLRTLNLSHNNGIQGTLPESILQLPNLEVLNLSNAAISGRFPASINLPSIRILDISSNSINGFVPAWICVNSSGISVLRLTDNDFTTIPPPGLGNCSSLEELNLASNSITGDLPEDIFALQKLRRLDIQQNLFSGWLSDRIGDLSSLVHVDISSNEFSGALPDVFDRLTKLQYFSAQSNGFTGGIPTTMANSGSVRFLSVRNNSLTGNIELNCSAMVNLVSLNLATNLFTGDIPGYLPICSKLKTVNFGRINFSGEIPDNFRNFQSLESLSLSNSSISHLSVALDVLQHCRNLKTLVLTMNFQDEAMPDYRSLQFPGLKTFVIANCRLTGSIPVWLSGCKSLQLLDLSWNRLDGSIPAWFGSLPDLFYLDLSNNSLTGDIPIELTRMPSLVSGGNASMVSYSMDFPFFVRRNQSGFKYKQVLSFPPTLELGNNFLTGHIWPEFGELKELHVFDLKWNRLTGPIPSNLSGMGSLEVLDLSFNNLTGVIPDSLTNLGLLRAFSVAHNNLSGQIPIGNQFITFPNSSFEGNLGLCGEHRPNPCLRSEDVPSISSGKPRRSKSAMIALGLGVGIGSVVVIAVAYSVVVWLCPRKVRNWEIEDGCVTDRDGEGEEMSSFVVLCQSMDNNRVILLDDLVKATSCFDHSNIIGCGGFGLVYKAVLSDGSKVAIKRLSGEHFQMEREFQAEIETLSQAQHPNLVQLKGYCKYKNDRLLIYEYMENGSLDYWLHERTDGPSSLDWEVRLRIAQGAVRGLAYLHMSCEPHILHRDIKSSNILLNEKFEAHLADFGLARLILPYDTHVSTDLVGTLGYIPPEYSQASVATYKGDIYSFGVVLLELLTSKRPMDMCRPKACRDLISWVMQMRSEKRETEVFDPFVYEKEHAEEMVILLEIACLCLSSNPRGRPGIQQLVSWLDNIGSISMLDLRHS